MTITVVHGEALDSLRSLPSESIDAVVTDPPYELSFMGKKWDGSGIAFSVDLWSECLRVLKPGGHLLSFGGSRTWHRMAVAVEDAGFELRDSIAWLYGSGFPKSLDVSKAIGKAAPATATAPQWQGWGTALKPAFEPIVVGRKPLSGGTVAENVSVWGTGALNIDGCRTTATDGYTENAVTQGVNTSKTPYAPAASRRTFSPSPGGRWPTNVVLDGGQADELDKQSGTSSSRVGKPRGSGAPGNGWGMTKTGTEYADTGGASRFFPVFRYQAKAPTRERPKVNGLSHPTVKPLGLMRWLVRLVTPPGGTVLDPFLGSGTTAQAAELEGFHCVGVERESDYIALIRERLGDVAVSELAADPVTTRVRACRDITETRAARRDECTHGHALTAENTYTRPSRPGTRECKACKAAESHRRYLARKAKER